MMPPQPKVTKVQVNSHSLFPCAWFDQRAEDPSREGKGEKSNCLALFELKTTLFVCVCSGLCACRFSCRSLVSRR